MPDNDGPLRMTREEFAEEERAQAELLRRAALLQIAGGVAAAIEANPSTSFSPEQVASRAIEIAEKVVAKAWGGAGELAPEPVPGGKEMREG